MSRLSKALRRLELLVLDVDGVLTDGGLSYAPDGQVWRRFDARDGLGLEPRETAFLGDDLNDLVVRPLVGLLVAPADGCRAVRRRAHLVLRRPGGHGAVRELAERILRAQGHWHGLARHGWRQRN